MTVAPSGSRDLPLRVKLAMYFRLFALQGSWNYETLNGTGVGFDCVLTRSVSDAVRIPVIASGGAGGAEHFVNVFRDGHADSYSGERPRS